MKLYEKLKYLILAWDNLKGIKPDFDEILIHPRLYTQLIREVEESSLIIFKNDFFGKRLIIDSTFPTEDIVYFGNSKSGLAFSRIPLSWYKAAKENRLLKKRSDEE